MKSLQHLTLYILICIAFGCSAYQTDDNPLADFELFFTYLKEDYAYRKEFDIEAIRKKYLPQIKASPTKKTLAKIVVNVEKDLQDPHVYFVGDKENPEESPYPLADELKNYDYHKTDEDIQNPVFNEINLIGQNHFYKYGTVKTDSSIGYIYIENFNFETGGSNALGVPKGIDDIETYIRDLKGKGVTKMIVDIRSDAGGSNYVPLWIAKRFANRSAVYMIEDYPVGNGFKTLKWSIEPEGEIGFREGKIALLTNGNTCSGGEMFVLAMLQRKDLVHIGSATKGCAGNVVDKDLANGWNLRITNSQTSKANGSVYFKVGIIPKSEHIVKNTTNYPNQNSQDAVILRAVNFLNRPSS